jgi:hypothetical protein
MAAGNHSTFDRQHLLNPFCCTPVGCRRRRLPGGGRRHGRHLGIIATAFPSHKFGCRGIRLILPRQRRQHLPRQFRPQVLVEAGKVPIPPGDKVLQLALPLDAQEKFLDIAVSPRQNHPPPRKSTYGMLMIADVALDRYHPDAGDVNVPPVEVVALRHGPQDARIDCIGVDNLELGESNPLLEPRRRRDARDHHQLHEFLRLECQLPPLGLLQPVLRRGNVLASKGLEELDGRTHTSIQSRRFPQVLVGGGRGVVISATYHLQPILPKILLPCLVEKWKLADMVDKDVAQNRQLRVERRYLAILGPEGGAEAPQRRRRVELCDFPLDLLRDELALQV